MPLYSLASRHPLQPHTRQEIASAITEAHCRETGAPAEFVNVVFMHGYPLPDGQVVSMLGGVRIGGNRTPEVIAKLRSALHSGIARAMDAKTEEVGLSLVGVPSNWIVEGGEVMPEPGAEAEWLARKHGDGG